MFIFYNQFKRKINIEVGAFPSGKTLGGAVSCGKKQKDYCWQTAAEERRLLIPIAVRTPSKQVEKARLSWTLLRQSHARSVFVWVSVFLVTVSSSFLPYSAIAAHLGSGRIRILAATGRTRPSFAPKTPTFEELGISGFSASQWNGFFISARTPAAIQARLVRDFDAAIKSKEVAGKLESLGLTPVGGTSDRLQKMLTQDTELIRSAIESGQFRAE